MQIISLRENPSYLARGIVYFQEKWASEQSKMVYEDCLTQCISTKNPLPQWYLMVNSDDEIIGCAGLITNDFISRMDLWPWICALYIEEPYRGKALGNRLIQRAKEDATLAGFEHIYLCTDHIGLYEKYGFTYIGDGYHPWGDSSRVYEARL